jgi:hypothetical protein
MRLRWRKFLVRFLVEWRSFAGVCPQQFCVVLRKGRKRTHLVSRLATVGLSTMTGPESGGMAGCGGRQSRSSRAVPRFSGCRATTDTTEDYPIPTDLGGPTIRQTSQPPVWATPNARNRLNWYPPWVWRQAQTLGFAGLRNRQSRATAGLVGWKPRRKRTPCRRPLAAFPGLTLPL